MSAVQVSTNNSTVPFIRSGTSLVRENSVILTDAGRTTPLVFGTVMAQIAATKKWVPLTDETAVDGSAIGKGVYIGSDIAAADLVAGDVVDVPILVGSDCTIDGGQVVLENSLTIDTVVDVGTVNAHRVEDDLNEVGIFIEDTVDIDSYENA